MGPVFEYSLGGYVFPCPYNNNFNLGLNLSINKIINKDYIHFNIENQFLSSFEFSSIFTVGGYGYYFKNSLKIYPIIMIGKLVYFFFSPLGLLFDNAFFSIGYWYNLENNTRGYDYSIFPYIFLGLSTKIGISIEINKNIIISPLYMFFNYSFDIPLQPVAWEHINKGWVSFGAYCNSYIGGGTSVLFKLGKR